MKTKANKVNVKPASLADVDRWLRRDKHTLIHHFIGTDGSFTVLASGGNACPYYVFQVHRVRPNRKRGDLNFYTSYFRNFDTFAGAVLEYQVRFGYLLAEITATVKP